MKNIYMIWKRIPVKNYEKYLYDLEKDPCEKENLIKLPGYEEVKKELRDKLKEYMKKAGEAVPEIKSWQEA